MITGERRLKTLLMRGDEVSIERGRIVISPASGKEVPDWWMKKYELDLIKAILTALDIHSFEYLSFSTGFYGKDRQGGLTLQFVSLVAHKEAYAIFNADLTRTKNGKTGKKGDPLPKKCFRVGKRSHFYKFWLSTGLALPRRLSEFGGYMGNLHHIVFTAVIKNNRIDASSLRPLSVPRHVVRSAILMGTSWASHEPAMGNPWASVMGKDSRQTHASPGLQPKQSTGDQNHGNTAISKRDYTGVVVPFSKDRKSKEQTVDEWLAEYRAADVRRRLGEFD